MTAEVAQDKLVPGTDVPMKHGVVRECHIPGTKKDKLVLTYTNCFVDRLGETLWHLAYHEWFENGFMDFGPCYATANSERFDSEEVALEVMEKRLASDNPFQSTYDPREI